MKSASRYLLYCVTALVLLAFGAEPPKTPVAPVDPLIRLYAKPIDSIDWNHYRTNLTVKPGRFSGGRMFASLTISNQLPKPTPAEEQESNLRQARRDYEERMRRMFDAPPLSKKYTVLLSDESGAATLKR